MRCDEVRDSRIGSGRGVLRCAARPRRAGRHVHRARSAPRGDPPRRAARSSSPSLGDFIVRSRAEEDTRTVGAVDVVVIAVKAYDNETALPMVAPMVGPGTSVLTLQNGVDSVPAVAAVVGEAAVIGGTTYMATALAGPGVIEQTGTHRRDRDRRSVREPAAVVRRVRRDSRCARGRGHPGRDGGRRPRADLGEVHPPRCAVRLHRRTRLPIGPVWNDEFIRSRFLDGCREVERLARAEGVPVAPDIIDRITSYVAGLPRPCGPHC